MLSSERCDPNRLAKSLWICSRIDTYLFSIQTTGNSVHLLHTSTHTQPLLLSCTFNNLAQRYEFFPKTASPLIRKAFRRIPSSLVLDNFTVYTSDRDAETTSYGIIYALISPAVNIQVKTSSTEHTYTPITIKLLLLTLLQSLYSLQSGLTPWRLITLLWKTITGKILRRRDAADLTSQSRILLFGDVNKWYVWYNCSTAWKRPGIF